MLRLAACTLALSLVSCQSAGVDPAGDGCADYVFVFIKTGPAEGLSAEQVQEISMGHFANMEKMANAGDLLVAGPLGPPKVDPDHRGIFVFDRSDVASAMALADTDPGAVAGVFVFEAHPWRASTELRNVGALDQKLRETLPPDAGPGATARPYALVRCADAAKARQALSELDAEGKVLMFGELTGENPPGALFALDAMDPNQAAKMLRSTSMPDGFWQVHPWFSSRVIEQM